MDASSVPFLTGRVCVRYPSAPKSPFAYRMTVRISASTIDAMPMPMQAIASPIFI